MNSSNPPGDPAGALDAAGSAAALAADVAAIGRISAVPSLLRIICAHTGMGFAAVARVTDNSWTACAVQDDIQFGLKPGGPLDVKTTLCIESRAARQPVVIDHASLDAVYCNHHTPRMYKIESYISVPIIRPNGEYFGNLCAIDPRPALVSNERTVAMFTSFAELIAHQLESEDRQEQTELALRAERSTSELREQFIAVLGHDLRNPLVVSSSTAEILVRKVDDAQLVKLGERLRATSRRMSGLIDDVLDFARGRLGAGMGLQRVPVTDPAQALDDVVSELRQAHPDRRVEARLDIAAAVHGDRARLQQLASNLLGNALTHGAPDQPVRIEAAIEGAQLVLWVANAGTPIPPDHLHKVFEPYWRPAHSQPGGGLGLGLYICSEIVRAHGGSIAVQSSATEGTRFTARIPV